MLIYIETSALNWLYENLRSENAFPTRNYQLYKGRKWVTSSVTLWELLNTSDEERRDDLLDFTRQLLYGKLIKSPEEIIISYIQKNCPIKEEWSHLESTGMFSKEWKIAASDFEYFFNVSGDGFTNRTKFMRFYRKLIHSYLENKPTIVLPNQKVHFLNHMVKIGQEILRKSSDRQFIEDETIEVAIIYVWMIICGALSLDFKYIEDFWKKLGIHKLEERFYYILKNYEDVLFRGPIANLSRMTVAQKNESSRGMSLDGLHSIYLTYTDMFLTADNHFFRLSNIIEDPNHQKVVHVNDIELFQV